MSLHKLTAGDGYTYLTRQVAASDSTGRGRASLAGYYAEKGETPGRWVGARLAGVDVTCGEVVGEDQMFFLFGAGRHPNTGEELGRPFPVYDSASSYRSQVAVALAGHTTGQGLDAHAPVSADVRAQIRTEVAQRMFTEKHGRAALDAGELSAFIATASRQPTAAAAGYDLTFSPVKSVSTLWALAPREVAERIQEAHRAAVDDTIGWLEREVAFTRVGSGGIRQVPVRGLLAAAFTHRDSRAGDPDLHTHVAVSNKVQIHDGRWFALDGRVLYAAAVTASERYNTRLEAELVDRLGVRFADRDAPDGKRPVREIVGVNDLLNRHWSSRRRDIEARQSALSTDFQSRHGRPPTAVEAVGAGAAGHPGDPRRQARTAQRSRPAHTVASRSGTGPRQPARGRLHG
ncbi:MAG: MobF family relaxase [Nocardioidaceae bacterium]